MCGFVVVCVLYVWGLGGGSAGIGATGGDYRHFFRGVPD